MNKNKHEVSAGAVGAPAYVVGAAVLTAIVGGVKQFLKGEDIIITEKEIEDYVSSDDPREL